VFGEKLRTAEDNEQEADGVHVGDEHFDDRGRKLTVGPRIHNSHQKNAEADIETAGKSGDEQAGKRAADRVEAFEQLLLEDLTNRLDRFFVCFGVKLRVPLFRNHARRARCT
jgi:hypothetical protein